MVIEVCHSLVISEHPDTGDATSLVVSKHPDMGDVTERRQVIPPKRYVEADLVSYALNVA